jgi:hypothetical protein
MRHRLTEIIWISSAMSFRQHAELYEANRWNDTAFEVSHPALRLAFAIWSTHLD